MKKTIGIIVCILLGLGGVFWFLVAKEERKRIAYKKEKEIRAKKMAEDIDRLIKLVNGPNKKPSMVKC